MRYLFGLERYLNFEVGSRNGGLAKGTDPDTTIMTAPLEEGQEWVWDYGDETRTLDEMLKIFDQWDKEFVSVCIAYLKNKRTLLLNQFDFKLILLPTIITNYYCFSINAIASATLLALDNVRRNSHVMIRIRRTVKSKQICITFKY